MDIVREEIAGELVTFGIPWRGKVVDDVFQPPGSDPTPDPVTFTSPWIPTADGVLMTSPLAEGTLPTTTLDEAKGYQWKRDFVANRGLYGLPINRWMMMDDYGRVHLLYASASRDAVADEYTVSVYLIKPPGIVFWGEPITTELIGSATFDMSAWEYFGDDNPVPSFYTTPEITPAPNGRKAAAHIHTEEDVFRLMPGYSNDPDAWCAEIVEITITGNPEHGETPSTLSASIAVVHAYADVRGPAWNDTETVVDQSDPKYYNLQKYEQRIFRAFYDDSGTMHSVAYRYHLDVTAQTDVTVTYSKTIYIDGLQRSQYVVASTKIGGDEINYQQSGTGYTVWNRDGQITNESVYYNNQNVIGKWGWPRDYDGRVFGLVDQMTAPTVNCVGKYTDSASDQGNADQYAAWDWYNEAIESEATDTIAFI